MSAPAAIQGTFADMRTVKSRAVVQLLIEVPIEQADAALRALGGVPQPSDPKWVAIARLDPKAASKADQPKGRPTRAWVDLYPSEQAGIRCAEKAFQTYLGVSNADEAAEIVRTRCMVESRSRLDRDHKSRMLWFGMDKAFQEATGRLAHG